MEHNIGKQKRDALLNAKKNGWDRVDTATEAAIDSYCQGYKTFLDRGKTERDCVTYTVELAQAAGFVPFERGMALKSGDKVYRVNRNRAITLRWWAPPPWIRGCPSARPTLTAPGWT